jgi:MarR family transcriptional regulator, organic hydroperoxide resistance regulator
MLGMLSGMANVAPVYADAQALEPTLDFLRLLWRIEHGLQSKSKQMEAALGVTGPQRLVLRIVNQFPGLSAGELAHIIRLHPSTVTGVVQRLVVKGLLARVGDQTDRRRVQLRVRPDAKRFVRRSPASIESAVARVLARVPAAHVTQTRSVLTAIACALEGDRSGRRETA